MSSISMRARSTGIISILVCSALPLSAQGTGAILRVRVVDTLERPVQNAAVELVPATMTDTAEIKQSSTDSVGRATLRSIAAGSYELMVRRIGYRQATRSVQLRAGESRDVKITLARVAGQLDTVYVSAQALPVFRRPDVSAAEIAASTRSLLSLVDVMGKLRPNVDYQAHKCLPLPLHGPISRGSIPRARFIRTPDVVVFVNGKRIPADWDPWDSIHSEHIAEIHYVNCFDKRAGMPVLPWPAIYVVLKPGYVWDLKRGSHAVGTP